MFAEGGRDIGFDAIVGQEAVLRNCNRRIGERIAAGVVIQLVASSEGVHSQKGAGAKRMLIAGSDVPGEHALALILRQLIVAVGHLKPVPRDEQIDVISVLGPRLPVKAIENRSVVSNVMERQFFGRIQETTGTSSAQENKIPIGRAAESQGRAAAPGCKGAPVASDRTGGLGGSEARPRGGVHDQAGFVAVLRVGRAGDQLHGLQRVGGDLGRK